MASREDDHRAAIALLFAKLQSRFGHKFTSQFPTDELRRLALDEWGRGLCSLTFGQIAAGLDRWNGDWPPSLTEFRRAALGLPSPAEVAAAAMNLAAGCYWRVPAEIQSVALLALQYAGMGSASTEALRKRVEAVTPRALEDEAQRRIIDPRRLLEGGT